MCSFVCIVVHFSEFHSLCMNRFSFKNSLLSKQSFIKIYKLTIFYHKKCVHTVFSFHFFTMEITCETHETISINIENNRTLNRFQSLRWIFLLFVCILCILVVVVVATFSIYRKSEQNKNESLVVTTITTTTRTIVETVVSTTTIEAISSTEDPDKIYNFLTEKHP